MPPRWVISAVAVAAALAVAGCSTPEAGPSPSTGTGAPAASTATSIRSTATSIPASLPATTSAPPSTAPATTVAPAPVPTPAPPAPGEPAEVVSRGDPERLVVALTFDAGSDRGFAGEILDTLAAEGIKASFGITGVWAEANPDLVVRMGAEGHTIINHTWNHRSFTGRSAQPAIVDRAARIESLARTEDIIRSLTGRTTKPWFRPPYGDDDNSVNVDVALAGYPYNIRWTIDSLGWTGLSAEAIADRCVSRNIPGAIHLFHVGAASQDAAALPAIISRLRADGYGFVTIPQMLGV